MNACNKYSTIKNVIYIYIYIQFSFSVTYIYIYIYTNLMETFASHVVHVHLHLHFTWTTWILSVIYQFLLILSIIYIYIYSTILLQIFFSKQRAELNPFLCIYIIINSYSPTPSQSKRLQFYEELKLTENEIFLITIFLTLPHSTLYVYLIFFFFLN